MTAREFDELEQLILGRAPPAIRNLYEVKLRLARERFASGDDVRAELSAMRREVAHAAGAFDDAR